MAVAYWAQPPGFDFCSVFIVDGVMMSGRNIDFLIINAARTDW